MALSILGAGFGRTGTKSLKLALEQLGFGPCHHMEEVLADPKQLAYWQAAAVGEAVDWNEVLSGYNSAVDWPAARYWRELAAFYGNAKIILTTRPEDDWWDSYARTIMASLAKPRAEILDAHILGCVELANELVAKQTFGASYDDRSAGIKAYRKHVEDVKASIPAERLLLLDITEGWEPLCRFLEIPIPEGPFPRANSSTEFWDDDIRQELK
ncbi:MAG: sulfotransferase family protein [Rhodospirillales bacterium]|nr:sulfotransferase family protein [Rhodospirillales bacterium]